MYSATETTYILPLNVFLYICVSHLDCINDNNDLLDVQN